MGPVPQKRVVNSVVSRFNGPDSIHCRKFDVITTILIASLVFWMLVLESEWQLLCFHRAWMDQYKGVVNHGKPL